VTTDWFPYIAVKGKGFSGEKNWAKRPKIKSPDHGRTPQTVKDDWPKWVKSRAFWRGFKDGDLLTKRTSFPLRTEKHNKTTSKSSHHHHIQLNCQVSNCCSRVSAVSSALFRFFALFCVERVSVSLYFVSDWALSTLWATLFLCVSRRVRLIKSFQDNPKRWPRMLYTKQPHSRARNQARAVMLLAHRRTWICRIEKESQGVYAEKLHRELCSSFISRDGWLIKGYSWGNSCSGGKGSYSCHRRRRSLLQQGGHANHCQNGLCEWSTDLNCSSTDGRCPNWSMEKMESCRHPQPHTSFA